MAASPELDDPIFDLIGQSLLEVIEEKNRTLNKLVAEGTITSIGSEVLVPTRSLYDVSVERHLLADEHQKALLHRMVIIAKLCPRELDDVGKYYEKIVKDLQTQSQTETITGLLLMYPKYCVHVIETSADNIVEFVTNIRRDMDTEEDPYLETSKILVVSHDIPSRLYQHWSYRVLNISSAIDEYNLGEDWQKLLIDMLARLLKLGMFLSHQPKVQQKNTVDTLREKVPELLPEQGMLAHLLDNDERCVESVRDFTNRYEMPYDTFVDADVLWPMPVDTLPFA